MFDSILFPTDGSELSDKATATTMQFAKMHQARVIALTVIHPLLLPSLGDSGAMLDAGQYETQMQRIAQENIDKVAAAANAAGIPFEGIIAMSPNPYEEIVEAAKKYNCDIIVMASHGRRGLNKLFLGSETQRVLSHTTLPVLVLR